MIMLMLHVIALQLRYVIGKFRLEFGPSNAIWGPETSPPGGLPGGILKYICSKRGNTPNITPFQGLSPSTKGIPGSIYTLVLVDRNSIFICAYGNNRPNLISYNNVSAARLTKVRGDYPITSGFVDELHLDNRHCDMFRPMAFVSFTFVSSISLALALTMPYIQDLTNSEPLTLSSLTLDVPDLKTNFSLDAGDRPVPVCDGNLLGFDMNRYSCLQAWSTIPTSYRIVSFGDRGGSYNVQLPRRFSGREFDVLLEPHDSILRSTKAIPY